MSLDKQIFDAIFGLVGKSFILDQVAIFVAQHLPYIVVLGVFVWALKRPTWKEKIRIGAIVSMTVILARGIITEAIRFFYYHPRPFEEYGLTPLIDKLESASFPSAHAAFFFALAFAVWGVSRKWGYWLLLFAVLNGLARIFVGVHHPLDILGGMGVGLISYLIVRFSLKQKQEESLSFEQTETHNPA